MNYHEDHEKRALDALAADMGLHDGANRDAALGLPNKRPITQYEDPANYNVEMFDESTGPMDTTPDLGRAMVDAITQLTTDPHDGTKPGPTTPCRTDAASLSELRARRQACRVVESAAWDALLESGLTKEQLVLLGAYNDSAHATRKAELDVHFAMFTIGGAA